MIVVKELGIQAYLPIWEKMKAFTAARLPDSSDELWLLEHFPVYTQGQAGKPEHILNRNNIPIIQSDRGGQVTYHGPGQLVAYILMDIDRRRLGIRTLVQVLETLLIDTLKTWHIEGSRQCQAPGVFVGDKKIASIGLRVKNGCTFHGIALNVNMDLSPFSDINPCGFKALQMTQIRDFIPHITVQEVAKTFEQIFINHFGTR